jgi:hypothetical protein
MKFICLGYHQEDRWTNTPMEKLHGMIDECFDYDDELREKGHFAGGDALQPSSAAKTMWWKDGKAVAVDGPYAETKEQIGGILILEAKDMDEAVAIMAKHPGVKNGPFEIRPVGDLSGLIAESDKRRGVKR